MLGNSTHASPELTIDGAVTPASDVYTLGLFLFELVVGAPPFGVASPVELLERKLGGLPRTRSLVSDCPAWLDEVIARAVAGDPADRFGSAAELRDALVACRV